ncbi:MAG: hypothetical protein HY665_04060 [Chloroflexi bacterium]|nr:hypothetical protein [Chloroflexota bacterium]
MGGFEWAHKFSADKAAGLKALGQELTERAKARIPDDGNVVSWFLSEIHDITVIEHTDKPDDVWQWTIKPDGSREVYATMYDYFGDELPKRGGSSHLFMGNPLAMETSGGCKGGGGTAFCEVWRP